MRLHILLAGLAVVLAGCTGSGSGEATDTVEEQSALDDIQPVLPEDFEDYVTADASAGSLTMQHDFDVPEGMHVLLESRLTWRLPSQFVTFKLAENGEPIVEKQPVAPTTGPEIKQRLDPGSYTVSILAEGVTVDERLDLAGQFYQVLPKE